MKVMKFGGTSVGSGENIRNVANIVKENVRIGHEVIVVVSAMADVTDRLIEEAEKVDNEKEEKIQEFTEKLTKKHFDVIDFAIKNQKLIEETKREVQKIIDELKKILTGICYVGELTLKSKDHVLSFGERLSALIVASALKDHQLESQNFTGKQVGIVTDSKFGEATPLMNFTTHQVNQRIEPLLKKKIIPVFINESDIPPLLSTKLGVQFITDDIQKTADQIYQLILKKLNL